MTLTHDCATCNRRLPEDCYRVRLDKVVPFRSKHCWDCERAKGRARAAARKAGVPAREVAAYTRCPTERVCDVAFREWRAVSGGAFQGARL